ncbi:TylF/MycF/NovP-related O-methyltransferase [Cytophagaceae bacterium DM2B3-1]|uniref:TylF/MycF/NovP-related O-methyltransferase n=1 Tax=Xanthocytophaga flava TaxID=3048013 RepID=A0ABT7CUR9_9BACT|nr:TylF/MycF/NovP-related O-methyltransferase [Xanthocytophaga flavus]MDJ1468594.1 TylF/MycF/NovP-related O-methyltransferase [Xanthocytophaga flavus]MDJ1496374.1 TylF/MycF/NovP-related O-methyltransferase [Xanthocytophaga flavus]
MIKTLLKNILHKSGLRVISHKQQIYNEIVGNELEEEFIEIYKKCRPYTLTSVERMYAAYKATEYIISQNITGAIVECGVWKGGSTMVMIYTLLARGITNRQIYLYDTFEGMSEPTTKDKTIDGESAFGTWKDSQTTQENTWCYSPLDEVQKNILGTGYSPDNIKFVKGKVEDTIPGVIPDQVALLRLDTDWYDSTYHELLHLFPILSKNGVLIIDDYGHWQGAREAVDSYFKEKNVTMLLNRIDYTGRVGIKI